MNLRISSIFIACFCCVIFVGCKKPAHTSQIIEYAPEIVMEQINFSSDVYHSSIDMLWFQKLPIIIYRYSWNMCNSCIIDDLMELRDFQKRIGKDHILVLPAYPDERKSKARLNNELADFSYQNISIDLLIIPIHETEGTKPYFAMVNNVGKLEMVFFPKRSHTVITQAYFKEVEKRLQR